MSARVIRWLGAWCLFAMVACAHHASAGSGAPVAGTAAADSLRGRIEVVGSEPGTSIALLMDDGARAVTLDGERDELEQLAGLEVTVWGGASAPRRFQVARFAVRAAHGVPAVDGVLARDEQGFLLLTPEGQRLRLDHLPVALHGHLGSRVWLAGPLDRAPDTYGLIRTPRRR